MSERMHGYGETSNAYRISNADDALDMVRSDMDYIPWDGDINKYEHIDGEYKLVGKFPRFITGTNKEIAEALENYGDPDEARINPTRPFPVWCNGEVIILYMRDGYLTYLTR